MADYDRWRGDRGGARPRDYGRGPFDARSRYEGGDDRFGGRREGRWDYEGRSDVGGEDFGRGRRDHPEYGSYPYPGRGRENEFAERQSRGGRWPDDGPGYDRGPGYWGGQGRQGGGSWRDRSDVRGRSISELAFGRDASGRDGDWEDWGPRRREHSDRGFLDRAGDEIASWFGDDDAGRRRRQDAREDDRQGYGEHRGRGPKSYQRSDDRIREDINDRLTDDPILDASDIEVSVSGREVTLSGTVRQRSDKRRAEDLAESVSGVAHVQNNLRVQAQRNASFSPSSASTLSSGSGGVGGTGASWSDPTKV